MLNQQTMTQLQGLGLQGMLRALNRQIDDPSIQALSFDERFASPLRAQRRPNRDQKLSIGAGILPLPLSSAVEM